MKKSIILAGVLCGIFFNSQHVFAAADDKYPASNFEPKVTYIDESAKLSTAVADDKYPAANFQPKVTYIDENVSGQTQLSKAPEIDEKYPAANFQAKVIFSADSTKADAAPEPIDPKYPAAYFKPRVIYP